MALKQPLRGIYFPCCLTSLIIYIKKIEQRKPHWNRNGVCTLFASSSNRTVVCTTLYSFSIILTFSFLKTSSYAMPNILLQAVVLTPVLQSLHKHSFYSVARNFQFSVECLHYNKCFV